MINSAVRTSDRVVNVLYLAVLINIQNFKLNCHIIYQIEKKIDVVVGFLVPQSMMPLSAFIWEQLRNR